MSVSALSVSFPFDLCECVFCFFLLFTSLCFVCFLFEINHNFCLFVAWCNFKVIFFYLYTAITNFIFFLCHYVLSSFPFRKELLIFLTIFWIFFLLLCFFSAVFFFLMPLPIPHFLRLHVFCFHYYNSQLLLWWNFNVWNALEKKRSKRSDRRSSVVRCVRLVWPLVVNGIGDVQVIVWV